MVKGVKENTYNKTNYNLGIQKAIEIYNYFYYEDFDLYNGGNNRKKSYKIIKVLKKYKRI